MREVTFLEWDKENDEYITRSGFLIQFITQMANEYNECWIYAIIELDTGYTRVLPSKDIKFKYPTQNIKE
jgi:hypothetical protein